LSCFARVIDPAEDVINVFVGDTGACGIVDSNSRNIIVIAHPVMITVWHFAAIRAVGNRGNRDHNETQQEEVELYHKQIIQKIF